MEFDTDIAAWWGAVVATIVLVWDVVKWSRDRPRIQVGARMPVVYWNSERIEITDAGSDDFSQLKSYCHIEIINKGNMPATIVSVCCSNKSGKNGVKHSSHDIVIHDGNKLPHVLGAGQVWSCRIPESSVRNIASQYLGAYVKVRLSHKRRTVYSKIKLS